MATAPVRRMGELEEPHGASAPVPHHHVPYYWIFFALVVLTGITAGVATHRFGSEYKNILAALIIATLKGTFVARYFMHLKFEGKLIYMIFFSPILLCLLLIVALVPDIAYGSEYR